MRIGENNYIEQLSLHNEAALIYVIDTYGGLLISYFCVILKLLKEFHKNAQK